MPVKSAVVGRPRRTAVEMSLLARSRAESMSLMKAPRPTLTSRTRASRPAASFFERMLPTIRGTHSTVAVTSRSAYIFLSAGAIFGLCPTMAMPTSDTSSITSAGVKSVLNPGIDSSLSRVPPVWPRPRPEIMGTLTPTAAAMGAAISDSLSPTPPVECLSTLVPSTAPRSRTIPERSMTRVSVSVSSSVMPRKKTAIRKADIW